MPYELRGNCVHKVGDSKPLKCYDNHADALKYLGALEANVMDANKADKPTNPNEYAYVPDKKVPSSWKLPIDTPEHISAAITALTTGFRGNKVEIPSGDKAGVVGKIRTAINKLSDKDQKANLLDRLSQVKALEKAFIGKLEPEDVNYIPLSTTKGKACANCRWFMADRDPHYACYLVDASDEDDEPILATGYCDRWEANAESPEDPMEQLAEALTEAIGQSGDVIASTISSVLPTPPVMDMGKSFKQRLSTLLKELRPKSAIEKAAKQSFFIFKDAAGQPHWHAIYTNNFVDREDEILTEKAHDKFIARLDMGLIPMPTLQAWHTPGSDHGQATCIWRDGHMVHAVGDFMDNALAKSAIPYYEKNARHLKMSHMFETPSWAFDGKHYEDYNTVEITTLPPDAAANPYTSFEELLSMKERSAEKTAYLEALFGKDNLAKIDAASDDINKGLEAAKVTFKEFTDVTNTPAKPNKVLTIETEKGLAEAYGDLVLQVNDLTKALNAAGAAIAYKDKQHNDQLAAMKKTWDDETAQWQKALDEVRQQVNLPIERPAHSEATVIQKGDTLKAQELNPDLNGSDPVAAWFGAKTKPVTALGGAS